MLGSEGERFLRAWELLCGSEESADVSEQSMRKELEARVDADFAGEVITKSIHMRARGVVPKTQ